MEHYYANCLSYHVNDAEAVFIFSWNAPVFPENESDSTMGKVVLSTFQVTIPRQLFNEMPNLFTRTIEEIKDNPSDIKVEKN